MKTYMSSSSGFTLTQEQNGPQIMPVSAVSVQCEWHHASLTMTINLCVAFFGQWIENKAQVWKPSLFEEVQNKTIWCEQLG